MQVIVGAGGHGRLLLDAWRACGNPDPRGWLDDTPELEGAIVDGLPVLGRIADGPMLGVTRVIFGIGAVGHPATRVRIIEALARSGVQFDTVIHPSAVIGSDVDVGAGAAILPRAVLNHGARIGAHVTVYTGAIVEHDCAVGNHVQLGPAVCLAGRVTVGDRAFVGLGAMVLQQRTIGSDAVIGAGALVTRDVPAGVTVVGLPAREAAGSR